MKNHPRFSTKTHSSKTRNKGLYLINDEYNTFEHVINCLVTICEHRELQAEQCALLTHYRGSCEIAVGENDDLIPLLEDLTLYGLNVEIF
jgi:ATP-dependent Clp protease adaptor protein ClpS